MEMVFDYCNNLSGEIRVNTDGHTENISPWKHENVQLSHVTVRVNTVLYMKINTYKASRLLPDPYSWLSRGQARNSTDPSRRVPHGAVSLTNLATTGTTLTDPELVATHNNPTESADETNQFNIMTLLETFKYDTYLQQAMQDVTDCRDSRQTMLTAGYAYPVECELDRMDCIAVRVKQYWQRMKDMWHQQYAMDEGPTAALVEIAENLGTMVEDLVYASHRYATFYRQKQPTETT